MVRTHRGGLWRALQGQMAKLANRRRQGIVLLAVLVFVALLLPIVTLVLTSINTESVATAEAIKGAKSELAAQKALNDAISLVVQEKAYPDWYVSTQQPNTAIIVTDALTGVRRDLLDDGSGGSNGPGDDGASLDGLYGTGDDYFIGTRNDGSHIGAVDDEASLRMYSWDYQFKQMHGPTYLGQSWSFSNANKAYAYSDFTGDPIWLFNQFAAEDGRSPTDTDGDGIADGYTAGAASPFVDDEPVLSGPGYHSGADEPRTLGPGSPVNRDLTNGSIEQFMYNAKVNIYESIFSNLDRGPIPSSLLKSYANVTDEAGRLNLNIFCKKVKMYMPEDPSTDYDLDGYASDDFNDNIVPGEAGWKWVDNPLFPDKETVTLRTFDTTNGTFAPFTGGSFTNGIVDFGSFDANTGIPVANTDGVAMPELGESVQHLAWGTPGGAGTSPYTPGNTPYSVQSMFNSLRMLMTLPGMDPQLAANILSYMNPSLDALDANYDPARSAGWPPDPNPKNGTYRQDAMNLTPPMTALNVTITGGTVNNFFWDFEANDYDDLPLPTPRPLTSLEQLRDIPGMTEAKFRRLKDHVTIFSYDTNVIATGIQDIPENANLVNPYVPGDPLYRGQPLTTTPASMRDSDNLADLRYDVGRFTMGNTLADYQEEADHMYAWLRTHLPQTNFSKITLPVVDRLGRASIADDRARHDNPQYDLTTGGGLVPHRDDSGATDTESGIYNVGEIGNQFPRLSGRPGAGYPALNPEFSVDSCLSILLYRNGTFFLEDDYNFSQDNGAFRPAANRSIFGLLGLNFFVPLLSIPENSALADLFTDHNNPFYDSGTNVNPAVQPHGPGAVAYAGLSPQAVYANLANPGQLDSAADLLAVPRYKFANMSVSLMADPPSSFRNTQPGNTTGAVNYYIAFSDIVPVRDYLDFIDPAGPSYDPNRVLYQLYFNFGNRPGVFPSGVWPFVPLGGTVVIPLTADDLRALVPVVQAGGATSQQNVTIVAWDRYNNLSVLSDRFTSHPQYIGDKLALGALGTLSQNFTDLQVPKPDNDGNLFGGTVDSNGNGRPDNATPGADWQAARPGFWQAFAYDSQGDPYCTSRVEAYKWDGWSGATGGLGQPNTPEIRADDVSQTYLQYNELADVPFKVDILPVRISGDQFELRSSYGGASTTGGTFLLYDWEYGAGATSNDGTWPTQQTGQTGNPQIIRVTPQTSAVTLRLYDLRTFTDLGSGLPYAGAPGGLPANVWAGGQVQPPPLFPSPLLVPPAGGGGYPIEGTHAGYSEDTVTVTPIEALATFRPQITALEPSVFANDGRADFRASSGGGEMPITYTLRIYSGADVVTINDAPNGNIFTGNASLWLNNPANPSFGESQLLTDGPASAPLVTVSPAPSDAPVHEFTDVDITPLSSGTYWVELQATYTDTNPGPPAPVTRFAYTVLQVDNENNPGGSNGGIPPGINSSINLRHPASGTKGFTASVSIDGGDPGYSYYWELHRPIFDSSESVTGLQVVATGNGFEFSPDLPETDTLNNDTGTAGADGRPDSDGVFFLHSYIMDKANQPPSSAECALAHDVAQVVITGGSFTGAGATDSLARTPMALLAATTPGNASAELGANQATPSGGAGQPILLTTAFGNAIDPDVAGRGDMLKLRGYDFGPTAASNRVNFAGGVSNTATSPPLLLGNDGVRDIYEITVMVPDGALAGMLSVTRTDTTPGRTSNQLFFQTHFNVVFDLVGNVNADVQTFQRFDLDFQGDGSTDFSFSTQTNPGTATEPGIVRGGSNAGLEHDYASDGIGNYDATLVVTDLVSGRRQVSHQLVTIRDLNPATGNTTTIVASATVAAAPGAGGATIDVGGVDVVVAGVRVGDRFLLTSGPEAGATANVTAIPGPTSLTLNQLSSGASYASVVGDTFSITRAVATGGQNGMLANIWPDVTLRSETFAQRPGAGTVFKSAVGGAGGGILRKWALGTNAFNSGGGGPGGGSVVSTGFADQPNLSGTGFSGVTLHDGGAQFVADGVQPGDFVFNESDGDSFAEVSPAGVAAAQLQMQNPSNNPPGSGLTSGPAPGRLRSGNLRIENVVSAPPPGAEWTLQDNDFNFFIGTAPTVNPAWRGGLVQGDGDPALVGLGAYFHNESDLTTWRVTANPTNGQPNRIRVEQTGVFSTPAGVSRTPNQGLRTFTQTAPPVSLGGVPPRYRLTTNTTWSALAGVVSGGLGATVYDSSQGYSQWRVVDVPNNYTPPGTLPVAQQIEVEFVSGATSTWIAGDSGQIVLPAQWATNWGPLGLDDEWSVLIPHNQWRNGDAYRVETGSGPQPSQGIGQSFADATYADLLAPIDFHLILTYQFDLNGAYDAATQVQVAWDGDFSNTAPTNLQNYFVGDTTRLSGTLDGLEVERIKITHGFTAAELAGATGSPGGAPTRARYQLLAVRSGSSATTTFGPFNLPVVTVGGDDYDTSLSTLNTNQYDNNEWQKVDFEASFSIGTRRYFASDQLLIPPGITGYNNSLISYSSFDRPFVSANFPGNSTFRHQGIHGGGPSLNWLSDANSDGRWSSQESPLGANPVDTFQFLVQTPANLMPVPGGLAKGACQPAQLPGVGRGDATGRFTFYTSNRGVYNGFAFTADNFDLASRTYSFDSQALFLGQRTGGNSVERLPFAADFYIDPVVGSSTQLSTFQAFVSGGAAANNIYSYQWTVERVAGGSGIIGPAVLPQDSPTLVFDAQAYARNIFPADSGAGEWRVSLAVSAGAVTTTCYREFELIDTPLSINVMAAPPSGSVGDTITFFVAIDGGAGPFDVTIDYGDGSAPQTLNNTGTLATFDHIYTQPSSTVSGGVQVDNPYDVRVTVTDDNGNTVDTNTMPVAQQPTVDIAETIPLNVDILVNPPSGVAPFSLTVHYSVAGGRRNATDGYFVLLQLMNADGTIVNAVSRSEASSFGANGQLDPRGPGSDDNPALFTVPTSGNYIVQALVADNGGAVKTASEDVFASGYLKPTTYGSSAPDVMRDREGRPMHAVRAWVDPFLNVDEGSNTRYRNLPQGTAATSIGGGRLMEADLQVMGDLFTGDPSSNIRSLGMYAQTDPLLQPKYSANYAAAALGGQAVQDYYDTFTMGRVNINTASEDELTAVFMRIRTRRAFVLPDDTSGVLTARYANSNATQAAAYADQVLGNDWVDLELNTNDPGLEQVRYAAFPPGDEYISATNARNLARDVIAYRTAFYDLHKPDAPDADAEFGYAKQSYAGPNLGLGQNFRVDHLPVIGPWDGVNPHDYPSNTRDAALLPPNSGNLHNAYDNMAGQYYNFDPAAYLFYSPSDAAFVRTPVHIDVQIDSNGDGVPDALFRTSEDPGNYAKYLNDVTGNREWGDNRGPYYSGAGGWETTGLVPSSTGTNPSAWSFDARNYFNYDAGTTTVNLNLLGGGLTITSTAGETVADARNRQGIISSNGVTAYTYIPNPPFRSVYDLLKVIDDGPDNLGFLNFAPRSFPLDGTSEASMTLSALGLATGRRVFSGPSEFRYEEVWSERASEFLPITNWLDDVAPFLTCRSYVFRVDAAGSVEVSGGTQTAVLDTASMQRDREKTAVIDVGPEGAKTDLFLGFPAQDVPGQAAPPRQHSYRILYQQE
jgi:hypothetical protein